MQKSLRFLTTLFCLSVSSLFAHISPGRWGVEAEFLYFLPTFDDTYFVIDGTRDLGDNNPYGTRVNNEMGFHPGFRVGGIYAFCDCNQQFEIYYSRLNAKETKRVAGNNLWATIGRPDFISDFENYAGSASSELNCLYQRVDALFAQQALCSCGMDLYLQAGLEYAYLRLNEQYGYRFSGSAFTSIIDLHSKSWGIGPQFGVDFDYALCEFSCSCPGRLSIAAHSSGSILVSRAQQSHLESPGEGEIFTFVNDRRAWRVIPAFHARVGLNYDTCFSCFGASLEIGYEFNTYLRGLSRVIFPDDTSDGMCFTQYYNFDVQGLYVAGTLSF